MHNLDLRKHCQILRVFASCPQLPRFFSTSLLSCPLRSPNLHLPRHHLQLPDTFSFLALFLLMRKRTLTNCLVVSSCHETNHLSLGSNPAQRQCKARQRLQRTSYTSWLIKNGDAQDFRAMWWNWRSGTWYKWLCLSMTLGANYTFPFPSHQQCQTLPLASSLISFSSRHPSGLIGTRQSRSRSVYAL